MEAIGVMAWGVCVVVSTADNVIRPLVISGATQIPFLLIMFGVLGGIASFGSNWSVYWPCDFGRVTRYLA